MKKLRCLLLALCLAGALAGAEFSPVIGGVSDEFARMLAWQPEAGTMLHISADFDVALRDGKPIRGSLTLLRGPSGEFAFRLEKSEGLNPVGALRFGRGKQLWVESKAGTVFTGTGEAELLPPPKFQIFWQFGLMFARLGAQTGSFDVIQDMVKIEADAPLVIRVTERNVKGRIELADENGVPRRILAEGKDFRCEVNFTQWETKAPFQAELFEPPAGAKRREVEGAKLSAMLGACLKFATEQWESDPNIFFTTLKCSGGMLHKLAGGMQALLLRGTPEEMGTAHGTLLKNAIRGMYDRILVAAGGYLYLKDDWFFDRIAEAGRRTSPHVPERFLRELDGIAAGAGLTKEQLREINFFPELFHCSGVAVRGKASEFGEVIHARVLDYMRDLGLQEFALLTVWQPEGYLPWISFGYAGFAGTVTAMNAAGLAIGEMGGAGEGDWDGIPMNFLMRRIMEECRTVEEALGLMEKLPLTCEYYYVLSDREGNLAAVAAKAGEKPVILRPGETHPMLPDAYEDVVYVSAGERAKHLSARIRENYGKIDPRTMMEMIRRPVAMKSNLHNAIFLPRTLTLYVSNAGRKTPACDEPYQHVDFGELLRFLQKH